MSLRTVAIACLTLATMQSALPVSAVEQALAGWRTVKPRGQTEALLRCMNMSRWSFEPSWNGEKWSAVPKPSTLEWPKPAGLEVPEGWHMSGAAVPVRGGLLIPIRSGREERWSVASLVSGRPALPALQILNDAPGGILIAVGEGPHTKALGAGPTIDPEYIRIDPTLSMFPLYLYEQLADGEWAVAGRKGLPEVIRAAVAGRNGALAWIVTDSVLWRVTSEFEVERALPLTYQVKGPVHASLSPSGDRLVVGMPVYMLEIDLNNPRAARQRWWRSRACDRVDVATFGCHCAGLPDDLVEPPER